VEDFFKRRPYLVHAFIRLVRVKDKMKNGVYLAKEALKTLTSEDLLLLSWACPKDIELAGNGLKSKQPEVNESVEKVIGRIKREIEA